MLTRSRVLQKNCENGDNRVWTYPFWTSKKQTYRSTLRDCCGHTLVFKGKWYCLTMLRLCLNLAPLIMQSLLMASSAQDETINRATSAYIENIFINKDMASVESMRKHLELYGLTGKDPEKLLNGGKSDTFWCMDGCEWWQVSSNVELLLSHKTGTNKIYDAPMEHMISDTLTSSISTGSCPMRMLWRS